VLALLNSPPAPPNKPEFTIQVHALAGLAYAHLHQFAEAGQELEKAEQLCAAPADPTCGELLLAHGVLSTERGRFIEAQRDFEQTLASAQAHKDRFLESTALLNLAAASLQQQHFDEALDHSDAAYRLAASLDFGEITLNALGNLGWAYYKLGDPEKALGYFVDAKQRATQLGSIIDEEVWLTTAGYVYLGLHNYAIAEQSYQQALNLAQQINSKEDILNALMSLALVSEQTGKLEQARQYSDRAITMARADGNRLDELYPLLVKGRVAARLHATAQAEQVFREVARDPNSDVSLKWAAEHALARLYDDENQLDSANRAYLAALSIFEIARSMLKHEESALPFLTNAAGIYDDYIQFLVARGRPNQALRVADYGRARTLTEGLGLLKKETSFVPGPLHEQEVARRAGSAILYYWLGEKQSYLWAVTPQKTSLFQLRPASEIDAAVQRYRKALAGPQDVRATVNYDGVALYQMLVAPAHTMLAKQKKILIIPHDSLNGLNFETLLVPEPKLHYWIEDVTVGSASSLRLLSSSRTSSDSGSGNLLLIGDPVAPSREYGELPKAAVEMENIEKHFAPAHRTTYARTRATVSAYLASKPEQFAYIHFVAHGTASRLSPLDSAVILSRSADQADSFKLYARDIIRHPLHARLVTISTCYGAGARAYTGEGLVGLSWAFLRAGAHNVVGALWEVNDTSTPQLMDQFYLELKNGRSPEVALRTAKLSLLNSNGVFRKPFYWAPFQLYGGY